MHWYIFGITPANGGPFTHEIQEENELAAFNEMCRVVRTTYPPNDGTTICLLGVTQA